MRSGNGNMLEPNKFRQFAEAKEALSISEMKERYGVTAVFREISPEQEELMRCWDIMDEGKRKSLMDVARSMAGFDYRSKKSDQEDNPSTGLKSAVK